jgi:5'-nucleotidase
MRIPNERRLANEVPELDLLLGGHDHLYHVELVNDVFFLKSGTDFEDFTQFKILFDVSPEEADIAIEQSDPN